MTDPKGAVFWWEVWSVPHGSFGRGWQFRDHEGCDRFVLGIWADLVREFRESAELYEFKTNIS